MGKLDGRIAIITGGGTGIGRGMALEFAKEGAKVVIASRNLSNLNKVVNEIKAREGVALAVATDVRVRDQVFRMATQVLDEFGRIDILVNNAAVDRHRLLLEVTQEVWDDVIDTDLAGPFWCVQAVAEPMMKQNYGKIINIASTAGVAPVFPREAHYSAARGGLVQLTKVLMKELGPYGINVNCIAPGVIDTPIHSKTRTPEEVRAFYDWYSQIAVVRRVGKVEDVAKLALFLASDESSYICGDIIVIDGGRTDRM